MSIEFTNDEVFEGYVRVALKTMLADVAPSRKTIDNIMLYAASCDTMLN